MDRLRSGGQHRVLRKDVLGTELRVRNLTGFRFLISVENTANRIY